MSVLPVLQQVKVIGRSAAAADGEARVSQVLEGQQVPASGGKVTAMSFKVTGTSPAAAEGEGRVSRALPDRGFPASEGAAPSEESRVWIMVSLQGAGHLPLQSGLGTDVC